MANEDIDYGAITEALNDKADRDFLNITNSASVPYHIAAEANLQSQIDAITAGADVKAVVGTYAELQSYDKTKLSNGDILEVLIDEEHGDAKTYYEYVSSTQTFTYIGSVGSTYTKAEIDESVVKLSNNQTITGIKTLTGISKDTAPIDVSVQYDTSEHPESNEYCRIININIF